jgi:hypothetical protein
VTSGDYLGMPSAGNVVRAIAPKVPVGLGVIVKPTNSITAAVSLLVAALVLVACGGGQPVPALPASTTPAPVPTRGGAPSAASPTADTPIPIPAITSEPPSSGSTGWSTDAKSHDPTPHLGPGILFSTRTDHHVEQGGFDRIVFEFKGPVPGYAVRYIDQVVQDGSGKIMRLPGSKFYLGIRFMPAQAHYDDGTPALMPNQHPVTPGHPVLHIYDVHSDFEGVVNAALGLTDNAGFRVGIINGQTTSRLYVDVK